MTFEEILSQAKDLTIAQRKELIFNLVESITEEKMTQLTGKRIAGLHAGQGWISDDFNDEPDAFWLGDQIRK